MSELTAKELINFIDHNPSSYHVIQSIKEMLSKEGFSELMEGKPWDITPGNNYYVSRNGSSIIAFKIPIKPSSGFQIITSHSDSPCFKIKENAEMVSGGRYTHLNVEKYGGMICAPWLDRPLSIAGRALVREEDRIKTVLVNVDRDLVMIPNLAIHMNRELNNGHKFNVQKDMLPILGDETANGSLMKLVADSVGSTLEEILGTDLFLYNRVPGTVWGANQEFLSCARLDDLQCVYSSLKGFIGGASSRSIGVCCILDNEEVGSTTRQGAASTFLKDTLMRLNTCLGRTHEEYLMALATSFMLSADNAHGVHPNYQDKADPTNRPYLNGGIVIKYNANQKYTTDAVSAALFKTICTNAQVPCQSYTNRSDIPGGSTLGNISTTQVAINTADIGLAQLAMHSPYETGGVKDGNYLMKAANEFYCSSMIQEPDGTYFVERG